MSKKLLAVLGLGGVGALLLSQRGRNRFRQLLRRLFDSSQPSPNWNERAQGELDRIQAALNRIAETLQPLR